MRIVAGDFGGRKLSAVPEWQLVQQLIKLKKRCLT